MSVCEDCYLEMKRGHAALGRLVCQYINLRSHMTLIRPKMRIYVTVPKLPC